MFCFDVLLLGINFQFWRFHNHFLCFAYHFLSPLNSCAVPLNSCGVPLTFPVKKRHCLRIPLTSRDELFHCHVVLMCSSVFPGHFGLELTNSGGELKYFCHVLLFWGLTFRTPLFNQLLILFMQQYNVTAQDHSRSFLLYGSSKNPIFCVTLFL